MSQPAIIENNVGGYQITVRSVGKGYKLGLIPLDGSVTFCEKLKGGNFDVPLQWKRILLTMLNCLVTIIHSDFPRNRWILD